MEKKKKKRKGWRERGEEQKEEGGREWGASALMLARCVHDCTNRFSEPAQPGASRYECISNNNENRKHLGESATPNPSLSAS